VPVATRAGKAGEDTGLYTKSLVDQDADGENHALYPVQNHSQSGTA
jgi:hypothetical protein